MLITLLFAQIIFIRYQPAAMATPLAMVNTVLVLFFVGRDPKLRS